MDCAMPIKCSRAKTRFTVPMANVCTFPHLTRNSDTQGMHTQKTRTLPDFFRAVKDSAPVGNIAYTTQLPLQIFYSIVQ